MIIPGQFGFNCPSGFREEAFWNIFAIGSNVKQVLYKFYVFYVDRKSKITATAIHRLTLDPMGKCSNVFFSETTNMIKAKLYMNVHWMVLYKLYVFYWSFLGSLVSTVLVVSEKKRFETFSP
jgi:hypothetical protein